MIGERRAAFARNKRLLILFPLLALALVYLWSAGHGGDEFSFELDDSRLGLDITEVGTPTVLENDVPGFMVFRSLWYRRGSFHAFVRQEDEHKWSTIKPDAILSAPTGFRIHGTASGFPSARSALNLNGTSMWLNENKEAGWTGLYHYCHFLSENVLGAFAALLAADEGVRTSGIAGQGRLGWRSGLGERNQTRLIVPWDKKWAGPYGLNQMVVDGLWPPAQEGQVNFIDPEMWAEMNLGDRWVFFDRVVIVDRWASHRHNHATQVWNKMSLQMFEYPSVVGRFASYWSPFRQDMLRYLDVKFEADTTPRIDQTSKPIVGYIDRQRTKRKFRTVVHAHLLDLFERLEAQGLMRLRHIVLEELSPEDQIRAVADLDVMFGIHGNGLTHEIWMKQDSTLIEVFPKKKLLRDYQSLAALLGHRYVALREDGIITPEMWQDDPDEKHPPWILRGGSRTVLHMDLVETVLLDVLGRGTGDIGWSDVVIS